MHKGKIVKLISNDYTVLKDNERFICKPRGKFRKDGVKPAVGDDVVFDAQSLVINEVLKRKNQLVRPNVKNVDQVIIIMSLKEPEFSTNLLDKLLATIEFNNIDIVICITKKDLVSKEEFKRLNEIINYYKKIGYKVFFNDEIEKIKKIFNNKISVFTGQTGAGKSTLLNMIDSSLDLKTGEISKALGRGKHTTRHVELLEIEGGLVADTPGFSSLDFTDMSKSDIRDSFVDFNKYRYECEYSDCMHLEEKKCAIKEKVKQGEILKTRYENYIKFIKE